MKTFTRWSHDADNIESTGFLADNLTDEFGLTSEFRKENIIYSSSVDWKISSDSDTEWNSKIQTIVKKSNLSATQFSAHFSREQLAALIS